MSILMLHQRAATTHLVGIAMGEEEEGPAMGSSGPKQRTSAVSFLSGALTAASLFTPLFRHQKTAVEENCFASPRRFRHTSIW